MDASELAVEGTLTVTDDGTVPAPDWYEAYEGPVEIVTPSRSIVIESRDTLDDDPRKLGGESAPFPLNTRFWHDFGAPESAGVSAGETALIARTQPDKILFDLESERRLYEIEGLHSLAARRDC